MRVVFCWCWIGFMLLALPAAYAEMSVTLSKTFITTYMDRATIDVNFKVDAAHASPNPGSSDGDLHAAGQSKGIKLPMVAEVMNAKDEQAALAAIHAAEASGDSIAVSGAWRLWWEHPQAGANQTQLAANTLHGPATNPDHAFEIHPLTNVAGTDVRDSFKKIPGYTPSSAATAFAHYKSRLCTVVPNGNAVTISTSKALYNYTRFKLKLTSGATTMSDGRWYYADVYTLTGSTPIATDVPLVFVAGTAPETAVKSKHVGDQMNVVGIPRVDLETINYIADNFHAGEESTRWYLPYEMIIVAAY